MADDHRFRVLTKLTQSIRLDDPPIIAGILHCVEDVVYFIRALHEVGIEYNDIYISSPPYTLRDPVLDELGDLGCNTYRPDAGKNATEQVEFIAAEMLKDISKRCINEKRKFLIIEDGGYLVPVMHKQLPDAAEFCLGGVEQTTNGVARNQAIHDKIGLTIPIASIPSCQLKILVEPPFIGEAVLRNIQQAMFELGSMVRGQKVGIVGFGAIGKAVCDEFDQAGAIIYVCDTQFIKQLEARLSGYMTCGTVANLLSICDIVIGTTGNTSIMFNEGAHIRDGIVLASASSKQVEIDIFEYCKNAIEIEQSELSDVLTMKGLNKIVLLFKGYPANFVLGYSLPLPIIDLVYSLMLDSAMTILTEKLPPGIYNCLADEEKLSDYFMEEYFSDDE